jgi:peptide/nickel transport system substrate-binding protein
MPKRIGFLIAALICAAGPVTACNSSSQSGTTQNPILRFGTVSKFEQPNPFNAANTTDFDVTEFEYPFLIQYSTDLKTIVPDLAQSWDVSQDGRDYTFHLVPNAKWSDGQPLDANDVAFMLNMIVKFQNGITAGQLAGLPGLQSASVVDPATVVVHYDPAQAAPLTGLQQQFILPQHVWAQYATGDGSALKTFPDTAPAVSGGPYILDQFTSGQFALLKRNPNYYGPKPLVDQVGLQSFSSTDAMIAALEHNQIDYAAGLPQTAAADIRKAGLTVETYPGLFTYALYINSKAPAHRELLNPTLRLAMAHAVDRQRMVDVAYPGSQVGASIVPPSSGAWSDPNVKPESFDLSLANSLLDQAGYSKGADGIRTAGGHKMAYDVLFAGDLTGPGDRVFQIMQGDFQQIGIQLTQKTLDVSAFGPALYGSNGSYSGWDLSMEVNGAIIDPTAALSYFTSFQIGGFNFAGYVNPQVEKLFQQQSSTADVAARQALVWQMQEIVYADRPAIVLYYNLAVEAHSRQWTGFVETPYGAFSTLSTLTFDSIHHV